ncbi:hypothetical protein BVG19_g1387 [[Candida] boidinii]|nr:hypothetical protein BVG19_g1387 [[Candida] boidinii]OWB50898.1 hypothetical protein B5S27_g2451 [[Candida] boidinii]
MLKRTISEADRSASRTPSPSLTQESSSLEKIGNEKGLNYVQLSKPFFTKSEINFLFKKTLGDSNQLRTYITKKKEAFNLLIALVKSLKFPVNCLQYACYYYQRFFLFNPFLKYINYTTEIAITSLFLSIKNNDYIKKLSLIIQFANKYRNLKLSNLELEEQRKLILQFEKNFLEILSFDFRNYPIEDLLIKFSKFYKLNENLTYLSWCILNDLYLTELSLSLSSNYCAMVVIQLAILISNELLNTKLIIDPLKLENCFTKKYIKDIDIGINDFLEYSLENYSSSFLKDCLIEKYSDKLEKVKDEEYIKNILINIKIKISEIVDSGTNGNGNGGGKDNKVLVNIKDPFLNLRDYDIGKTGSIRFLYHEKDYIKEI